MPSMKAVDYIREALEILGDRGEQYGTIQESCSGAANIRNELFGCNSPTINGAMVCQTLFSLKMARYDRLMGIPAAERTEAQNKALKDSIIDCINYIALLAELEGACPLVVVDVKET